jgi:6-phosphogluconolactonase (cycloisomerase 2 family)
MKFSNLRQLFLVSSIGLLVATLLTACQIVTIDYVFVANSGGTGATSDGQIETFAADSQSGALRTQLAPVDSGGVYPVAMATTSDYQHLYVANETSGTVTHFTIASNGALAAKDSVSVSNPVALAVNTAGTYLYVVSGTTSATLTEYALSSGTIGAAISQPLTLSSDVMVPAGITVLANTSTVSGNGVYVAAVDQTTSLGYVFGFTVGTGGALAQIVNSPYQAGVKPSGIASDPTDRFVYVTDYASNHLIGYTVMNGSTLQYMTSGPFSTGNQPTAVVVDPRGKYIYVTNSLDSTISSYAITLATGVPTLALNSSGGNVTNTDPVAIVIDPALGRFIYTANYLDNSISGFVLNPNSGSVTQTQATPYPAGSHPTALVAVPHGNHAIESVTP